MTTVLAYFAGCFALEALQRLARSSPSEAARHDFGRASLAVSSLLGIGAATLSSLFSIEALFGADYWWSAGICVFGALSCAATFRIHHRLLG